MVDAAPFPGVRYDPDVAGPSGLTSAPAYDRLRPQTFASHRDLSPYTVLELLTPTGGTYGHANATLRRWLASGVLKVDPTEAFYRYDAVEPAGGAAQRGLLAAVRLEPLGRGDVLPHEEVDAERVAARLERVRSVPIDLTPIVGLVHGAGDADAWADVLAQDPVADGPLVELTDEGGALHRLWRLDDARTVAALRTALAPARVVIADGHHRYATALAHAAGDASDGRTLMYLVDCGRHSPRVEAVHRLLRGVGRDALDRLAQDFTVADAPLDPAELVAAVAAEPTTVFALRLAGAARLLRPRDLPGLRSAMPADRPARWLDVDAAVLEHVVLPRVCPPGAAPELEPVADVNRAAAQVDRGAADALFILRPVDVDTVVQLAVEGHVMPPKSTSFRPKPRAGLVMRMIGPPPTTLAAMPSPTDPPGGRHDR